MAQPGVSVHTSFDTFEHHLEGLFLPAGVSLGSRPSRVVIYAYHDHVASGPVRISAKAGVHVQQLVLESGTLADILLPSVGALVLFALSTCPAEFQGVDLRGSGHLDAVVLLLQGAL